MQELPIEYCPPKAAPPKYPQLAGILNKYKDLRKESLDRIAKGRDPSLETSTLQWLHDIITDLERLA